MASHDFNVSTDFESFTVKQLQNYLRSHGEFVSGKKSELILRARGLRFIRENDSGCSVDRQSGNVDVEDSVKRHLERLVSPLGESLPNPSSLKHGWTSDEESMPGVSKDDLYNYLVLSKQRTLDNAQNLATRQLKAKVFYMDQHVHSVAYHEISKDCSHCFVKAMVIPSLPSKKSRDYDVWVCLSKVTGHVHSALCDCTAGEGESCNHIAALLYALVDITVSKTKGLHAPTSKKCLWKDPRKRKMSPCKSQDMVFKKHKFDDLQGESDKDILKKSLKDDSHHIEPVNRETFARKLLDPGAAPHASWLFTQDSFVDSLPDPCEPALPALLSVDFNYADSCDLSSGKCVEHFQDEYSRMSLTEEECQLIEKSTRGQAKNEAWIAERKDRLTASTFGQICKLKPTTAPECTLTTVMGYSYFTSKQTKWGSDHEPAARRKYNSILKQQHPNTEITVSTCGLLVNKDYPYLGASPDALVREGSSDGILEIKCPYKHRMKSVFEAAKDPTFFCSCDNGKLSLKHGSSYYYQVQGLMAISNRQWCDFFVWTLKDSHIERIVFDVDFWNLCQEKLAKFYLWAVIPEIFSRRVLRGKCLYVK